MEKSKVFSLYFITVTSILLLLFVSSTFAQQDDISSLIKERRYPEAAAQLKIRLKTSIDVDIRSQSYHQLGELYYNYTQQYPEALKAYERILGLKDKGIPIAEIYLAYIKVGDVYSRMGNYDRAVQYFQALVDMAPETHFVHEIGLRRIRDIENALKNLENQEDVIKNYKGTHLAAVAQFQIAELYRSHSQLNQPELAITAYQTLLHNHPYDKLAAEAQWRIAHIRHTVLHQITFAIDAYKKVVEAYPTTNFAAEALYHIGNLHRDNSEFQLAIDVYDTIIEKYPNFWNMHAVYYWSGNCHEQTQNYTEAHRAYKIYMNIYLPDLDPVYFGHISMYDKSLFEVTEILTQKIKTLSDLIPKHEYDKIQRFMQEGRYNEAVNIAKHLIITYPDTQFSKKVFTQLPSLKHLAVIQNLQAHILNERINAAEIARSQLQIATIYERELLNYSKAVEAYNKVVKEHAQSPYAAEALYRIGVIYTDILEKPNSAINSFTTITKKHPNTLQAMMATFQVGEIFRKLQRYDEAIKAYQTTIAYPEREIYLSGGYKDSYADRAQFLIGRVHFEDQRYSDARIAFEEFIKTRTDSPRLAAALIYLAVMHQQSGNDKQALEIYQQAEKIIKNNHIQKQMVVDEAGNIGFQSSDDVIQFLQERQKRIKSE